MQTAMATTVSRRTCLSRLLLAAAVAPVMGAMLADTADANKKKKKNKRKEAHVGISVSACENENGTVEVIERPGGTTVNCTDSDNGDWSCTHTSQSSRCYYEHTAPTDMPNQPLAPETPFAGPTQHGDRPLQPASPYADPLDGAGQPLE